MHPVIYLFNILFDLYSFVLVSWVILNLLFKFNIVNMYNEIMSNIMYTLNQFVHPPLKIIKRYIKSSFNGIDLSVALLLAAIHFIKYTINYYFRV
ncbi:MAG: YggT family protein [Wolbachia endosymbiont of Menacanthus eurysternus]|nr:MAG: YggT family protein [Wolbachia endosymbiont of Menacanthus eurysternus]